MEICYFSPNYDRNILDNFGVYLAGPILNGPKCARPFFRTALIMHAIGGVSMQIRAVQNKADKVYRRDTQHKAIHNCLNKRGVARVKRHVSLAPPIQ